MTRYIINIERTFAVKVASKQASQSTEHRSKNDHLIYFYTLFGDPVTMV